MAVRKKKLISHPEQYTILGGKIFTGTSVLFVPRCEQFSENEAQGKL